MSNVRALNKQATVDGYDDARVGGSTAPGIFFGNGSPEGFFPAVPGSIFFRMDHTDNVAAGIFRKTYGSGNGPTGWMSDTDTARWTDVLMDVGQASGLAALSFDAYRDTSFNLYCFRYDQTDELQFKVQFPHDWQPNSEVRVHMHAIPLADPATTQTIALAGSYCWAHYGAEVPAASGWTTFTATHDVAAGDVFKSSIISLFHSTPTGAKESSILLCRVNMSAATTYTTNKVGGTVQANLAALYLDAHYQRNKWGTVNEAPT